MRIHVRETGWMRVMHIAAKKTENGSPSEGDGSGQLLAQPDARTTDGRRAIARKQGRTPGLGQQEPELHDEAREGEESVQVEKDTLQPKNLRGPAHGVAEVESPGVAVEEG